MNRLRSTRRGRTLAGPAACVAALVFSAAATAAALPQASDTPRPCGGVAKGAPWSYKGQKGTAYTVVGVNGALVRHRHQVHAEVDARSIVVRSRSRSRPVGTARP